MSFCSALPPSERDARAALRFILDVWRALPLDDPSVFDGSDWEFIRAMDKWLAAKAEAPGG